MKHCLVWADDQISTNRVDELLSKGWKFDPRFGEKPIKIDVAVIFPLVLYEAESELPKPEEEEKRVGLLEDVTDVISVDHGAVSDKFREGYRVREIYAAKTVMIRRAIPVQVTA